MTLPIEYFIHYELFTSNIGFIGVAKSARGICAIMMDDNPAYLITALQNRFGKDQLHKGDTGIAAHLTGLIQHPTRSFPAPLDIQGTVFQKQVWAALCTIPSGSTATYSQIAQILGMPKAVRAVAGACAANKLALIIPCHRIIKQNGDLSGYRWGIERKHKLLALEKVQLSLMPLPYTAS